MLRQLELWLLEIIARVVENGGLLATLPLWGAGLFLLYVQFRRQSKTILPGVLSLAVLAIAVCQTFFPLWCITQIANFVRSISTPTYGRESIPLLEPIFRVVVAPLEIRTVLEETFLVALVAYLVFVAIHVVKSPDVTPGASKILNLFAGENSAARPERSKSNELGSADFATMEQVKPWIVPSGKPGDTVLEVEGIRGAGGVLVKKTKFYMPSGERNRHVLIVAKTGSGKTTKLILPVLHSDCLDPMRSTIIIDSKPEMWRKLAGMTAKYNPKKKILLFNPLDTARSLSWNILSKIENDTDAKLIANTIVMATDNPTSKSDSPFFRNNALSVLNSIMVGLLNDKNDRLSMPRVHEIVQSGNKKLADWLEAHPEAIRTSRAFVELVRSGSQNADTIVSELSMRLAAWDLKAIRATTYFDEIDLECLIKEPTLFIVELRESELEMLRPMANVIVTEILRFLTKRAESFPGSALPRPVGLVIDEFASALGRIPDIHVKLNTLRSRNVSIVAAVQSLAQIQSNYGDDGESVIAGFSTKFFMPSLDVSDAEWASKESGQMTIRFQTTSSGSNKKIIEFFASKNDGSQEQVQQRAVLTPDEIGRPVDNICTFFFPNTPVFQGHLVPHYKIPEMLAHITEFDKEGVAEFSIRQKPIELIEKAPEAGAPSGGGGAGEINPYGTGLRPGITNTKGWTDDQIKEKLEAVKKNLEWEKTSGSARKWWLAFENENKHRLGLVLRLAEELQIRKATITEFFLAYVYSNTDNIQANLSYLDYTRLKREEEKRKKDAKAAQAAQGGAAPAADGTAAAPATTAQTPATKTDTPPSSPPTSAAA